MPLSNSVRPSAEPSSVHLFLRQARYFQRAVESDSPSAALPILRRLIKVGAISETSLTQLFRTRQQLQRKHFLRMLALEAGFSSWEIFRPILAQMSAADLAVFQFLETGAAQLKLWFADCYSAQQYAAEQGGRVISVGQHAIVIAD
jgi:hypothetical protein